MRIAVAGATGLAGARTVAAAVGRGHEVVTLSRRDGVDLVGGDGLGDRLAGVDVVIDLTSTRGTRTATHRRFFRTVTTVLLRAEQQAAVGHHLVLSVVGSDRVTSPHYRGKQEQELLVRTGPTPWTIQRSTQFHAFAEQVLGFVRLGPVSVVPRWRCQPLAAAEVAERLVDLAEAGPGGDVEEIAGPEEHDLADLSRQLVSRLGLGRAVVPVRPPAAIEEGALLPATPGPRGVLTFGQWLDDRASR